MTICYSIKSVQVFFEVSRFCPRHWYDWIVSGRRVLGWCLIDSGYCQDCIDGVAIDKNHFISSYSTTAFPSDALHNANINRFDSVWKVSGGCLDESGYCLDGYHAKAIVETPMKEHWLLFWLDGSFYLDDPGLANECTILGCLKGAWQMSGRCLELSEWFWILSGVGWGGWGYDVKLIDINPIRVIFISWFHLSQVPLNVWRLSGKCLRGVWELSVWLWILSGG